LVALYFAVPAVTGQLVLGAKSGASSLVNQAIGGVAGESGKAASSRYTGLFDQMGKSNMASTAFEATAASMRKSGLAERALKAQVSGMQAGISAGAYGTQRTGFETQGAIADLNAASGSRATRTVAGLWASADKWANQKGDSAGGTPSSIFGKLVRGKAIAADFGSQLASNEIEQNRVGAKFSTGIMGMQSAIGGFAQNQYQAGFKQGADMLQGQAGYEAAMDVWEAKRDFGNSISEMGGVVGVNPGSYSPGEKPSPGSHQAGAALSGIFGKLAQSAASFAVPDANNGSAYNDAVKGSAQDLFNQFGPTALWSQAGQMSLTGAEAKMSWLYGQWQHVATAFATGNPQAWKGLDGGFMGRSGDDLRTTAQSIRLTADPARPIPGRGVTTQPSNYTPGTGFDAVVQPSIDVSKVRP
jgi:hypothetical protein